MTLSNSFTGTHGDDSIRGTGQDDHIVTGRGEDTLIGGRGSDVMSGGLDADTFVWSAGHIGDGDTDYVTDFSLKQGDSLSFLDSGGGQQVQVLSVALEKTTTTEHNGIDLKNNVDFGTDVVFTIMNSVTGAISTIVLMDSWSGSLNDMWEDYLGGMGLSFDMPEPIIEPPMVEIA